jgi:hypothetical protein
MAISARTSVSENERELFYLPLPALVVVVHSGLSGSDGPLSLSIPHLFSRHSCSYR